MARYTYAGSTGDFVIDVTTGRPTPNIQVTVWTAQTGGTQVTDLLNTAGSAVTYVTSDSVGFIQFQGPDGMRDDLWIYTGTGSRMLVRAQTTYALSSDISTFNSTVAALQTAVDGKIDKSIFNGARQLLVSTAANTPSTLTASGTDGLVLGISGGNLDWINPATQIAYVNTSVPIGTIVQYAVGTSTTSSVPEGWLVLDGSEQSISNYPDLFALYGTRYGGNGTTTFRLPDAGGRVLVGQTSTAFSGKFSAYGSTETIDSTYLGTTVKLTPANLPPHTHTMTHNHTGTTKNNDVPLKGMDELGSKSLAQSNRGNVAIGKKDGAVDMASGIGVHAHNFTTKDFTGSTGDGSTNAANALTSSPISIVQPYLVVKHIVKARRTGSEITGQNWPIWAADSKSALSSLSGISQSGSTWSIQSSSAQIALASAGTGAARPASAFSGLDGYAIECEVFLDSATFNATDDYVGLAVSSSHTSLAGMAFRIRWTASGTRDLELVTYAAGTATLVGSAVSTTSTIIPTDTWIALRFTSYGGNALGYVYSSSTWRPLIRSNSANLSPAAMPLTTYPVVFATTGTSLTARFRNLEQYSLSGGAFT